MIERRIRRGRPCTKREGRILAIDATLPIQNQGIHQISRWLQHKRQNCVTRSRQSGAFWRLFARNKLRQFWQTGAFWFSVFLCTKEAFFLKKTFKNTIKKVTFSARPFRRKMALFGVPKIWSHQRQNEALTMPVWRKLDKEPDYKRRPLFLRGKPWCCDEESHFWSSGARTKWKKEEKREKEASEGKSKVRRGAGPLVVSPSSSRIGRWIDYIAI